MTNKNDVMAEQPEVGTQRLDLDREWSLRELSSFGAQYVQVDGVFAGERAVDSCSFPYRTVIRLRGLCFPISGTVGDQLTQIIRQVQVLAPRFDAVNLSGASRFTA